jgi:hypothetical protein
MQSTRDSSIWRSLAVAFGDGVAFGVGVKLAQRVRRPPAGAAPAQLPPAVSRAPFAPAPFDRKVLEAVVNALEARLQEQAGQVERRLTGLEAKLALDLKNLECQDRSIAAGLQTCIDEAQGQYNEHMTGIRDAVAQDMDVLYSQIAQLRQEYATSAGTAFDERIAAAVTAHLDARIEILESRVRGQAQEAVERASAQIRSAAAARVDEQLAPLRAALSQKDRELAELRQRIADSERNVLELILAMGQMCRQVADRIATAEPAPAAEPPRDDDGSGDSGPSAEGSGEPPAAEEPPAVSQAAAAAPSDSGPNGHAAIEPMPVASDGRSSHLWRVPLVSSFLMLAAGSLWTLR